MIHLTLNNKVSLSLIILTLIFFTSCTHTYYAPSEPLSLDLTEQHDLQASVGYGKINGNDHINLQLAYSPIKNIGIGLTHFQVFPEKTPDRKYNEAHGYLTEIYLGAYSYNGTPIYAENKTEMGDGLSVSGYLGYGQGFVKNYYEERVFFTSTIEEGTLSFDFRKYFVQAGLSWRRKIIKMGFLAKVGALDYRKGVQQGAILDGPLLDFDRLALGDPYRFIELTYNFEIGMRQARLYTNFTLSDVNMIPKSLYESTLFRMGLVFDIDDIFRKRPSQAASNL